MKKARLVFVVLALAFAACKGEPGGGKCEAPDGCIEIPPNEAPTAAIKAPKLARTGQSITLDASKSTDPEGGKLKYLWLEGEKNPANNFFDGVDLTEAKLTITPDVEGKFTYTVEVKDDAGNKDSATVTVEVSSDYVPPELKAPSITGVVINGMTFNFATTPSPVVFTTATGVLTVKALGTDLEDDAEGKPLTTVYSANVTGPTVAQGKQYELKWDYNAAEDDDPFGQRSITVQVKDSDGLKSATKTIDVRIVPRASAQLAPLAAFVDCGEAVDGTGLDMTSPRNSLAGGYATAMANGLTDVFVAADLPVEEGGAACKGTQVDFHGINLWGLFHRQASWRRMTEVADRLSANAGSNGHRYALQSTIQDPQAYNLVYATGSTYTSGSLLIDGFTFNLSGWNYFAVSLTTAAGDSIRIDLLNNEFSGNTTSVATKLSGVWVPGGILIQKTNSSASSGVTSLRRNLFAVSTTDSASVVQAWVDSTVRNSSVSTGTIQFYANVFTGEIKTLPLYQCNAYNGSGLAARFPFAFCFHQYNTANVQIARNSFYGRAFTSGTYNVPAIVSTSNGKFFGYGNHFSAQGSAFPIRLAANAAEDLAPSTKYGWHFYSSFPTDANSTYVFQTDYNTGNSYATSTCVNGTSFGTGAPPCTSIVGSLDGKGSFNYDYASLIADSAQSWRIYAPVQIDAFAEADIGVSFNADARWDFDGFYGPKDNGTGNGTKYNAGAFESLP